MLPRIINREEEGAGKTVGESLDSVLIAQTSKRDCGKPAKGLKQGGQLNRLT